MQCSNAVGFGRRNRKPHCHCSNRWPGWRQDNLNWDHMPTSMRKRKFLRECAASPAMPGHEKRRATISINYPQSTSRITKETAKLINFSLRHKYILSEGTTVKQSGNIFSFEYMQRRTPLFDFWTKSVDRWARESPSRMVHQRYHQAETGQSVEWANFF